MRTSKSITALLFPAFVTPVVLIPPVDPTASNSQTAPAPLVSIPCLGLSCIVSPDTLAEELSSILASLPALSILPHNARSISSSDTQTAPTTPTSVSCPPLSSIQLQAADSDFVPIPIEVLDWCPDIRNAAGSAEYIAFLEEISSNSTIPIDSSNFRSPPSHRPRRFAPPPAAVEGRYAEPTTVRAIPILPRETSSVSSTTTSTTSLPLTTTAQVFIPTLDVLSKALSAISETSKSVEVRAVQTTAAGVGDVDNQGSAVRAGWLSVGVLVAVALGFLVLA